MSSSSNDSKSPSVDGLGWLNDVPAGDAAAKAPAPPPGERVLTRKQSLAPPPAGRRPLGMTTAGIGPSEDGARDEVVSVPELPADMQTPDDPLADLFDGSAQPVVIDATLPAEVVRPDPPRPDPPPIRPEPPASVARVGLAKTLIGGPAHEIMAMEAGRDPRADPDTFPRLRADVAPQGLEAMVFDPEQSVARHLAEATLDASVGAKHETGVVGDLADLGGETPPARVAPAPRSMRSAMMIIGLVLISGAVATAISLGIMGGPPSRLRPQPTANSPTQPAPTPAVAAPEKAAPVKVLPSPTPVAAAPVAPPPPAAVAVVEPASVAVVEPAPVAPTAVLSGDPVTSGDALLRAGDFDAAATQYRAALAADADDHHAMEGMARVHLARGEPALALPFAEAIVKRRPKRSSYRALLDEAQGATR